MFKLLVKPNATRKEHSSDASRPALSQPHRSFKASGIMMLQRIIGNRAMQRILPGQGQTANASSLMQNLSNLRNDFGRPPVHQWPHSASENPTMNQPGDRYEQEADRVADHVMALGQPNQSNQRDVISHNTESVHGSVSNNASGGNALNSETRQFFEPRFGHSFANVRVHSDSSANEAARSLGASAYTVGENITFGSGEYQPSTQQGRQLLAHELAHVVQQSHSPQHSHPHTLAASLSRASSRQVQPKLIATGDAAGFAALANSIIAVQFEIRVAASGEVTIHSTNIQGPPTRDAQELLNTLRTAINDPKTTSIEFIRGATSARASDRNVIVGNYQLARVDLDDVEAFGRTSSHSREGDNAAVQLVHEITEQYRKQVHSEAFPTAHRAGYAAQERVLGATLVRETPMTPIGGDLGEVTTTYRYPDGREVDVVTRMNFRTGNIVSVRRVIR